MDVTILPLLEAPGQAASISRKDALVALSQCAEWQARLNSLQLALLMRSMASEPVVEDRLISVDTAAKLLNCHPRWIRRNANCLPFVRKLSARKWLCSELGVREYLKPVHSQTT